MQRIEQWDHTTALVSSVYGAFTGKPPDPEALNPYREQEFGGGYDPGAWFDKHMAER